MLKKQILFETRPRVRSGNVSIAPTKNRIAAGRTYDGLMMCVERYSVHGAVSSQNQVNHFGNSGKRREQYQAKKHKLAKESRFSRM